jgi:hypothetical protein
MRSIEDIEQANKEGLDFNTEIKKLNKHMNGDYVCLPKAKISNPDSQ